MVTRHQYYADKSRQAIKKSKNSWGGRYSDGIDDKYDPRVFNYTQRKPRKNSRKKIYKYTTTYKKMKWKSYGKKYGNR